MYFHGKANSFTLLRRSFCAILKTKPYSKRNCLALPSKVSTFLLERILIGFEKSGLTPPLGTLLRLVVKRSRGKTLCAFHLYNALVKSNKAILRFERSELSHNCAVEGQSAQKWTGEPLRRIFHALGADLTSNICLHTISLSKNTPKVSTNSYYTL